MADLLIGTGLEGFEIVISVVVGVAAGALAQYVLSQIWMPKKGGGIMTLVVAGLTTGIALLIGLPLIRMVADDPISIGVGLSAMTQMLTMHAQRWVIHEIHKETVVHHPTPDY